MEKIKIIQRVKIKTIITEGLKNNLLKELDALLKRTETEQQHLSFKIKRTSLELEKKHSEELLMIRNEFQDERYKNHEEIRNIKENMEAITKLVLGEETCQGSVDRIVDVKVGDDWDILEHCEIVLKDNKVIEIRKVGSQRV